MFVRRRNGKDALPAASLLNRWSFAFWTPAILPLLRLSFLPVCLLPVIHWTWSWLSPHCLCPARDPLVLVRASSVTHVSPRDPLVLVRVEFRPLLVIPWTWSQSSSCLSARSQSIHWTWSWLSRCAHSRGFCLPVFRPSDSQASEFGPCCSARRSDRRATQGLSFLLPLATKKVRQV